MFISDIDSKKKSLFKTSFVYLLVSLFCVLFGSVYEQYSHEVYSNYMIYAFVFPLAFGTLPPMVMLLINCKKIPGRLSLNVYHSGIATLTIGSIMEGVLEIYGTTNDLIKFYWIIGLWLLGVGFLLYLYGLVMYRLKAD